LNPSGVRTSDASDGSGGFGSGLVNDVVSPPPSKRAKVVAFQGEAEGVKPAANERNSTEGDSKVISIGDQDANDVVPVADQDEQDESKQEREDDNNASTNASNDSYDAWLHMSMND